LKATEFEPGPTGRLPFRRRVAIAAALVLVCAVPRSTRAASVSAKDLQLLGRTLVFLQPGLPRDGVIAIAYVLGDAASRQDADAIAAALGDGLRVGDAFLWPRVLDTASLPGATFSVVIAAAGAAGPRLAAAVREARALCVTTDLAAVQAGFCTMAIATEPRVSIVINHELLAAAGIGFAPAFRMMIKEI
jgi:hypothetical protein